MRKINKGLLYLSIPFLFFGFAFLIFGLKNVILIHKLNKNGIKSNAIIYNIFLNDTETGLETIIEANYYFNDKEYFIKEAVYKNKERYKVGDSIKIIFLSKKPEKALIYEELDIDDNIESIRDGILIIICPFLLWLFYKPKEG